MCKSSLVNKNVFLIEYAITILKAFTVDNERKHRWIIVYMFTIGHKAFIICE